LNMIWSSKSPFEWSWIILATFILAFLTFIIIFFNFFFGIETKQFYCNSHWYIFNDTNTFNLCKVWSLKPYFEHKGLLRSPNLYWEL
jgi:hypothetical protein